MLKIISDCNEKMFLEKGFADYLSKLIIQKKKKKMIQKYLPAELLLRNDLGQKEKNPV